MKHVGILGQTFVKHERQALLVIGHMQWDRWALGRLGCPHPMAASKLNRVVQQLGIRNLSDLAARAHEIGTYKGIGVTTYWLILAILEHEGYEVQKVHGEDEGSYHAMKARAIKEANAAKPRKRRKKAA